MINLNRKKAIKAIENLGKALEACGIESTTQITDDAVILLANMWNCNDGGVDRLEVWAEDRTNYTVESCVNPLPREE